VFANLFKHNWNISVVGQRLIDSRTAFPCIILLHCTALEWNLFTLRVLHAVVTQHSSLVAISRFYLNFIYSDELHLTILDTCPHLSSSTLYSIASLATIFNSRFPLLKKCLHQLRSPMTTINNKLICVSTISSHFKYNKVNCFFTIAIVVKENHSKIYRLITNLFLLKM
jgi:hypothetical protein